MAGAKVRPIRVDGQAAYVPLTMGYVAVINVEDAPLVSGHNWRAHIRYREDGTIRAVYAIRRFCEGGRQPTVYMHRVIARTPDGMETDHQDGDGLNNRRANLRPATTAQNQHNGRLRLDNTSGAKGVVFHKRSEKWMATLRTNGKKKYLGLFGCVTAAMFRLHKERAAAHGAFAKQV